jgi:protein TonB
VAEPVEEPPPATRLDVLPAEASILPVPPPRSQEEPSARVEAVRPLPIPESKVEPIFPPVARSLRARGTVVLEVLVGVDGKVRRTRVLDCTRPGVGFEAAAARAVAQWEFRPGRVGDQPVEASTVVRVEFR